MGEKRNKQFADEKHFDTVQYPVVKTLCGQEVAESILLIRSRINRVMCQSVSSASMMDKITKYSEFIEESDKFNKQLNDGYADMKVDVKGDVKVEASISGQVSGQVPVKVSKEVVNKSCDRCSSYRAMIQKYNSDPRFVESEPTKKT